MPIEKDDARAPSARVRRLLLAKELHTHGFDHSKLGSSLDKMIAVHNFHNAVELTLRAIVLEYEIRAERELNIDFESLLNAVDQFAPFQERNWRLPYRPELRRLNSVRNLVQHHAHEPEESTMEEWRVFSTRFLHRAFKQYFETDFESLSEVTLIADLRLRSLLLCATSKLDATDWTTGSFVSKYAFELASRSLGPQLPSGRSSWSFFAGTGRVRELGLTDLVHKVEKRVAEVEQYALFLTTGGRAPDLGRYRSLLIFVILLLDGYPRFEFSGDPAISDEDAKWLHRFVVQSILRWQNAGMAPSVPEQYHGGCDRFLAEEAQNLSGAETSTSKNDAPVAV